MNVKLPLFSSPASLILSPSLYSLTTILAPLNSTLPLIVPSEAVSRLASVWLADAPTNTLPGVFPSSESSVGVPSFV